MAKIEPAVTQLAYLVPAGSSYIDLAKDLSKVNRRLYRQGYTYVVQDIQMGINAGLRSTDVSVMTMATVGNSWIVHNAWKKGFAAWRRQVRDVETATGIKAGTWNDFKVYLDDTMEDGTILEPYAGDGAVYQAGDWDYSALVFSTDDDSANDDEIEKDLKMHLIGSTNLADTNEESGIGLINEYQNSRSIITTNDPSTPSGASATIYAKLMNIGDELSDRVVDNVEAANDMPPYDHDDYPGGAANADAAVPVRMISASGTQTTTTVAGFIVPCGLIKIESVEYNLTDTTESLTDVSDAASAVASPGPRSIYQVASAQTTLLIVTLAAGPYRGVLAAPMGQ